MAHERATRSMSPARRTQRAALREEHSTCSTYRTRCRLASSGGGCRLSDADTRMPFKQAELIGRCSMPQKQAVVFYSYTLRRSFARTNRGVGRDWLCTGLTHLSGRCECGPRWSARRNSGGWRQYRTIRQIPPARYLRLICIREGFRSPTKYTAAASRHSVQTMVLVTKERKARLTARSPRVGVSPGDGDPVARYPAQEQVAELRVQYCDKGDGVCSCESHSALLDNARRQAPIAAILGRTGRAMAKRRRVSIGRMAGQNLRPDGNGTVFGGDVTTELFRDVIYRPAR